MTGRMIIRKIVDSLTRTESLYHGLRVSRLIGQVESGIGTCPVTLLIKTWRRFKVRVPVRAQAICSSLYLGDDSARVYVLLAGLVWDFGNPAILRNGAR